MRRRASLEKLITEESDGNQRKTHDASTSIGSAEGISKSPFGTEGNPIIGVGGDGHTDSSASDGSESSNYERECCVCMFELLYGSVDNEKHHTNKNEANQVFLFEELLGTLS